MPHPATFPGHAPPVRSTARHAAASRRPPWETDTAMQPGRGQELFGLAVRLVLVMALAAILSVAGRTITVALTDTLGQAWPFSLTRCRVASPGCDGGPAPHGPMR